MTQKFGQISSSLYKGARKRSLLNIRDIRNFLRKSTGRYKKVSFETPAPHTARQLPYLLSYWKYFIFIDKLYISHTQRELSPKNVNLQTVSCLSSMCEIHKIFTEIAFSNLALSNSTTLRSSLGFTDKIYFDINAYINITLT